MASTRKGGYLIFKADSVSKEEFLNFWSSYYFSPIEHLYKKNITKPLTSEKVYNLYIWKNGSKLSEKKKESVRVNYINRLDEFNSLPVDISPKVFLNKFDKGGAIWRIFWLHCWQPTRFPIYDMHVHRGMAYLEKNSPKEISALNDHQKIKLYLEVFLPYVQRFSDFNQCKVDKAFWAFGKFLSAWNFKE